MINKNPQCSKYHDTDRIAFSMNSERTVYIMTIGYKSGNVQYAYIDNDCYQDLHDCTFNSIQDFELISKEEFDSALKHYIKCSKSEYNPRKVNI